MNLIFFVSPLVSSVIVDQHADATELTDAVYLVNPISQYFWLSRFPFGLIKALHLGQLQYTTKLDIWYFGERG